MSNKHWLECRGGFLQCNSPPTGLMRTNSKCLSPPPPRLFPPLLLPGQRHRGSFPLMGQFMSSAVSSCTQHSGPKLVKQRFLHILSFHLCFESNLSRFSFLSSQFFFSSYFLSEILPLLFSLSLFSNVTFVSFQRLYRSGKDWGV